jgi:hypothetical protein
MNKVLGVLSLFALPLMAQTTKPSPTAADAQRAAEVDQRGSGRSTQKRIAPYPRKYGAIAIYLE